MCLLLLRSPSFFIEKEEEEKVELHIIPPSSVAQGAKRSQLMWRLPWTSRLLSQWWSSVYMCPCCPGLLLVLRRRGTLVVLWWLCGALLLNFYHVLMYPRRKKKN